MPALSKLDAVNRMLTASGLDKVSTLTQNGVNDATQAEDILDDSIREIQSKGMNFNTEVKKFYPDTDSKIALTDNIFSLTPWSTDSGRRLVQRGNYLYDVDENRFTFPNDTYVYLKVVYEFDFEDLPNDIQYWIADHAARQFQMQTIMSREMDAYLSERLMRSEARAKQYDMQNRNDNFNKNYNGNTGWGTLRNRRGLRGPR